MKKSIILLLVFISSVLSHANQERTNYPFLIVIGDKVNVRSSPKINSKILTQLRIASEVKLLKLNPELIEIDNLKGHWAFIDTGKYSENSQNTIRGWIFDHYLSTHKNFKKLKSFNDLIIDNWIGDSHFYFEFYRDGTFKSKYIDDSNGEDKYMYKKGYLSKFKQVIIACNDDGTPYAIFYLSENGTLCSPYPDANGNQICAMEVKEK